MFASGLSLRFLPGGNDKQENSHDCDDETANRKDVDEFYFVRHGGQSPKDMPSARAVRTKLPSGRTVFKRPTASLIFTDPTCEPWKATILPKSLASISSTA